MGGRPARRFAGFPHAARTSWSRRRRVVGKAEHLPGKANHRFVVTSLPAGMFSARTVYERVYCPQGDMENTIKEQQLALLRPDLGVALRRQPAPGPLLRLRVEPLRCSQARACRHPPGPRHRRNAPAQAPRARRPRHGLGAQGQGRHGLRASPRRCLRTGPRPIARVILRPRVGLLLGPLGGTGAPHGHPGHLPSPESPVQKAPPVHPAGLLHYPGHGTLSQ